MTAQTITLTDFLLARIAEDEDTARRALEEAPGLKWVCEPVYDGVYSINLGPATHPDTDSYGVGEGIRIPREMARHIEANSPTRVLDECEAKRRIVNATRSGFPEEDRYSMGWHDAHLWMMHNLAQPYADHPDYCAEWKL